MSLASGIIKLAPVKMGDLISASANAAAGATESSGAATSAATSAAAKEAYLAPHLRGTSQKPQEQPKMDAANFPSLGAKPVAKPVWNKTTVTASSTIPTLVPMVLPAKPLPPMVLPNFKATVDAYILKEKATEAEKKPETDFNKMTKEEKEADGWTVMNLRQHRAAVVAFLDKIEEKEFPECHGNFTFGEMYALCSNYEKRADKEMNIYKTNGHKGKGVKV
jgi:hypothetical protein